MSLSIKDERAHIPLTALDHGTLHVLCDEILRAKDRLSASEFRDFARNFIYAQIYCKLDIFFIYRIHIKISSIKLMKKILEMIDSKSHEY